MGDQLHRRAGLERDAKLSLLRGVRDAKAVFPRRGVHEESPVGAWGHGSIAEPNGRARHPGCGREVRTDPQDAGKWERSQSCALVLRERRRWPLCGALVHPVHTRVARGRTEQAARLLPASGLVGVDADLGGELRERGIAALRALGRFGEGCAVIPRVHPCACVVTRVGVRLGGALRRRAGRACGQREQEGKRSAVIGSRHAGRLAA